MTFRKVITLVVLALPCHKAVTCDAASGICNDEISLVQVKKTIEFGKDRSSQDQPISQTITYDQVYSKADCGDLNPVECGIRNVTKAADEQVYQADMNRREALSNAKVARANEVVQKQAVDQAKFRMKQAKMKSDFKKQENYTAYRKKRDANHKAYDEAFNAEAQAASWNAAVHAEDTYRNISHAADMAYARRKDAQRYAAKMKAYALKKYQDSVKAAQRMEAFMGANYTVTNAKAEANAAATSRLRNDYLNSYARNSKAKQMAQKAAAKAAGQNASQLVKDARKAEALARKYARYYRRAAGKAFSSNISKVEPKYEHIIQNVAAAAPTTAASAGTPGSQSGYSNTKTSQTITIPMR